MKILDGKAVAERVRQDVKAQAADGAKRFGKKPGLAVVLVGDDPASQVYVGGKIKACNEAGIESFEHRLPASTDFATLKNLILGLNADPKVHGILVQLPLPKQLNEFDVISLIDPKKDPDGLTTHNLGLLIQGKQHVASCTPAGVMEILRFYGYDVAGMNAVVIGRSRIVGLPMAQLLIQANATVTTAHSKSKNLKDITTRADIVVAAAGQKEFFGRDYFKPGAIVIDVGIHRGEGKKLSGDVKFDEISHVAACTPVPGGVGPMTITMLLKNTVTLFQRLEEKNNG